MTFNSSLPRPTDTQITRLTASTKETTAPPSLAQPGPAPSPHQAQAWRKWGSQNQLLVSTLLRAVGVAAAVLSQSVRPNSGPSDAASQT